MSATDEKAPAASIANLTVALTRDGVRAEVLRGVDLKIQRGEIVGLVGESGSGKSVLALALMGLLPSSSRPETTGTITIAGTDMIDGSAEQIRAVRRHELGVIFQDPMTSLNPTMRVGRQITEATGDKAESLRLMSAVGIQDAALRFTVYPHELSGGLRQRIMAAIASAGRPSLIIADEPTTALDVTVQAQVLDLLRQLRDEFGCSVVLITHDLAVAAQIADRIAVLYAGRIAELGPADVVLREPTHPYTVGLLNSRLALDTPRDTVLQTLRPETATVAERMRGCAYSSRCPLADDTCRAQQPPLLAVDGSGAVDGSEHVRACWRDAATVRELALTRSDAPRILVSGSSTESAAPAVVVEGVHQRFVVRSGGRKREVHALRGIDLTIGAGEAVSIVGESGSGKSTLLRAIAGLVPVTSGRVDVARGGAQMVFQDAGSSLTPWLSVGEILGERLLPLRLGKTETAARVTTALEAIGLPASVSRVRPADLSGGQRQRVALARATMIPPAVLLCDEPTSALDASLAASVLNLIRGMREELSMTVLFVTHDLSVARLMGDRVVVMTEGRIVEDGTADQVIHHPEHPYTRSLLASVPEIEAVR
ncbi:oligopeptide/dipeptide ABC transporter ATP-binding protein [Frondihabitans sp. Leaf304]|uniref:oligopeptide/dipeptide ABC transporter ATP-binding protein n=1 Tax=Frondihabitans sp. Leaf304 TaxID=1736329 RepID=UPI0006F2BB67|nr:ABC transporter ATP-binding protein [Frondihabitans sp. Leaf304]KQQ28001.1 peptide ABC transporter ATP-binding protein [Frondihabitans sp. Leaf304]